MVGKEGEGKMHGMYKYESIELCLNASKLNCKSKHQTSLSTGFRSPSKALYKTQVQST